MKKERKYIGGKVIETKQEDRNGVPVGIVSGYIATWDLDRGDWSGVRDRFVKGAFVESILEHVQKRRQIRLKDHHGRTVGGFPIEFVKEDARGLFGVGEINLDVQQGREAFALAKQGVLTDFSIGFGIVDSKTDHTTSIRTITKATVWEGSIVDEPMNPHANITQVKSVVPYQDFPLADREQAWDADSAVGRIRQFSNSEDMPNEEYKKYFLWYDQAASENFGAYKMPIADIVDGQARAIPSAIFAAAAVMQGARGGVDIPEDERAGVKSHIERYYAKLDMPSPFNEAGMDEEDTEEGDMKYYSVEDVKDWTARDIEKALREGARFSKSAAKAVMSKSLPAVEEPAAPVINDAEVKDLLSELRALNKTLTG